MKKKQAKKKAAKKRTVDKGIRHLYGDAYQITCYDAEGTRRYKTVHSDSNLLKDLRILRSDFMREVASEKKATSSDVVRKAGFDEIWDELEAACKAKGCTPKTIGGYKKRYYRLFREFPEKAGVTIESPEELTEPFLNRYLSWYVNSYESKVQIKQNPASEVNVIKILLGRLKRLGFLTRDSYERIKDFVKLRDNEDDYYPNISNSDLKRLFDYIAKDSPEYHDFFMFLFLTGRRPMETTQIMRESVQIDNGKPVRVGIMASTAKNRRKDQIELHQVGDVFLKAVISNAFRRSQALKLPYLFSNAQGKRISANNQLTYIKKVSKLILGVEITAKYFRKRYCTQCGLHRVPIRDAMARSGHRDVAVFVKHYQRPTQDGIRAVIDAVGLDGSVNGPSESGFRDIEGAVGLDPERPTGSGEKSKENTDEGENR